MDKFMLLARARRTYVYDEGGNRTETISWGKGVRGGRPRCRERELLALPSEFKVRKSGGVLQQSATRRVSPRYPDEAKEKRVSARLSSR